MKRFNFFEDGLELADDFVRLELISELTQTLRLADSSGFDIVAVHISQALDLLRQHLGSNSSLATGR